MTDNKDARRNGAAMRWMPAFLVAMTTVLAACTVDSNMSRQSSMLASGRCGEKLGAEFDVRVDPRNVDPAKAREAVRAAVNRERCQRSLPALSVAAPAQKAARQHARAMAKTARMSHTSSVRGQETLERRLDATNANFSIAGENIARTPLYAMGDAPFHLVDGRRCVFQSLEGGQIHPHSYRRLGEHIVRMWMESPEHRRNVLHRSFRGMGAGIAIRPDRGRCGEVFAAAVFMG